MIKLGGTRNAFSIGDKSAPKYYLYFSIKDNAVYIDYSYYYLNQGTIYFKTGEDCQNAINTIGENRIKKYLFCVKN